MYCRFKNKVLVLLVVGLLLCTFASQGYLVHFVPYVRRDKVDLEALVCEDDYPNVLKYWDT